MHSLPTTCKSVVIHGVGDGSLDEVEITLPGPDDVLIKVRYVGVCATDLHIVDGSLGYYRNHIASYPVVPGHEVSGIVCAMGDAVVDLSSGDAVVVECIQGCGLCDACRSARPIECEHRAEMGVMGRSGGYAEYVTTPARFVQRVPEGIDLTKATLCEPLAVVLKGLKRLARFTGEEAKTYGVIGAGPLGYLCALVLAHRGREVTLFDRDPRRLVSVGKNLGHSQTLEGLEKFDALIEATGDQQALETALETSRAGATLLILGFPYSRAAFSFERLVGYDKAVIGSVGSSSVDFSEALKLLPHLDTSALTEVVLPLRSFQEAWESARNRSHLKILLAPGMP